MSLSVEGATATDVKQSVKSALAKTLAVSDMRLITVNVTQVRRLKQGEEPTLRRLAIDFWKISYSVQVPTSKEASVRSSAAQMNVNGNSFSQELKTALKTEIESSGRDPSAMTRSFQVSGVTVAVSGTTVTATTVTTTTAQTAPAKTMVQREFNGSTPSYSKRTHTSQDWRTCVVMASCLGALHALHF